MKKYAVITASAFGKLWYYEENLPNEWWTSTKSKAMLFNSLAGAEMKAFWIVGKYPELIGKVELFEGEETEFGRKRVEQKSLSEGPAGDLLGTILGTLFGEKDRGRTQGSEQPLPQNPAQDGQGGAPPEPRNRRKPPRP